MLLGILSDSHGHWQPVRKAVELFQQCGVGHIIHCGDIGGVQVLDELVGCTCTLVWGNTDVPTGEVLAYARGAGLSPPQTGPARMTLDGKSLVVFHGHERGFEAACIADVADYVLHGHTHQTRDERCGKSRIINPGALHRARPKTVATLDLQTDQLTFHEVE